MDLSPTLITINLYYLIIIYWLKNLITPFYYYTREGEMNLLASKPAIHPDRRGLVDVAGASTRTSSNSKGHESRGT